MSLLAVLNRFGHNELEPHTVKNWRPEIYVEGLKCNCCGLVFILEEGIVFAFDGDVRGFYHYTPSFTTKSCKEICIQEIIE